MDDPSLPYLTLPRSMVKVVVPAAIRKRSGCRSLTICLRSRDGGGEGENLVADPAGDTRETT